MPPFDSDSEDAEEEEPPAKCGRRDERGRFEAEPWQARWPKWAQICRRVPTSAINANVTEVLPAGAVLWAWEADPDFDEPAGEQWLTLLPAKFNEQVWYGWRLDPRELVKAPAEQPGAAQTREGQQEGRRGC